MTHHLAHHLWPVAARHETLHRTVVQRTVVAGGVPQVDYPTFISATP